MLLQLAGISLLRLGPRESQSLRRSSQYRPLAASVSPRSLSSAGKQFAAPVEAGAGGTLWRDRLASTPSTIAMPGPAGPGRARPAGFE